MLTNPQVADMGVEFMCRKVDQRHRHMPVVVVAEKDPRNLATVALQHGAAYVVARSNIEHLQLVVIRGLRRLDQTRQAGVLQERAEGAEPRCMSLLDSSRDASAYVHDGMHVYANSGCSVMRGNTVTSLKDFLCSASWPQSMPPSYATACTHSVSVKRSRSSWTI